MKSFNPRNEWHRGPALSGMDGVPISWGMKGKRLLYFLVCSVVLTGMSRVVSAQAINCSSGFNTTSTADGGCGISVNGQAADFWIGNHPSSILSGSSAILAPSHAGHLSNSLIKQVAVNNQAFTTSFRFVPNGLNVAFILENDLNPGAGQYPFIFAAGAGGEGGLSQFAGGSNIPPSHVFALMLDQYSPLVNDGSGQFTYSSAQIYQTLQVTGGVQSLAGYLPEYPINKISTSPVALNAPANAQATTTGHTYSATINYDGYTLTLNLFDVTAGGSCPGANCFTHTWTGVYIPEITGATTAYAGLVAGTSGAGGGAPNPLLIDSFTYAATTPTGAPSFTAWNANSTYNIGTVSAASPVYSVAPGTYPGTQTVAISTSTSPHNYICYLLSSTTPALYPQPDNNGGCSTGTLYTTPISIASTATLYAMAGSNNAAFPLGSVAPPGLGPPSTLVAATYTIAASSVAATPTFSPAGGAYSSTQSVTLSDQSPGAVICYNTTGSPATNGANGCTAGTVFSSPISVSSTETIYAVAGGTGYTDSQVAASNFIIKAPAPKPVATTATLVAATTNLVNGQQASLTATISAASGAQPTGNVSFFSGSQLLGTATLNNGQANLLATLSAQPGSFQVSATYNGSDLDNKSTSSPITLTVVSTTTVALISNVTQVIEGSPVALTAVVTPTFGSLAATGSVAFYVGGTALGTQQLSNDKAAYSAPINLPAGTYQLTAVYAGDTGDETSSSNALAITVTAPVVPQASTKTSLTITPVTPAAGQSLHLSSIVTAASGSTPTGVVNFFLGQTQVGSATLTNGAAAVSVNAPSTTGSYQLTAVYAGTSQDSSSTSSPVTITIAPTVVATTTSLVSSAQQVTPGEQLVLSAMVNSGSSSKASGAVNFFLGHTQLGSVALTNGQATWTGPAAFSPGTYQLTAVYAGEGSDAGSTSNTLTLTIVAPAIPQVSTITTLSISPSAPVAGQSMYLTSLVTAVDGSALSGIVNFYLGQTQVGSTSLVNGIANASVSAPASSGTYQLTAAYAGNVQDTASTSTPLTITIAPNIATTSITLAASSQQLTQGQPLVLTAAVSSNGAPTAGGTVNFFLGQTLLGSSSLSAGQASWSGPASFTPGTYQLTATYAGDALDTTATSSAVQLTIIPDAIAQPFSTMTALSYSPQQVYSGQSVNIAVQVAEQAGSANPTGMVAVYLGQTLIGTAALTNGGASIPMQAPAPGTYTLTAAYTGEGQDLSSQSAPVNLVVNVAVANVPIAPTQPGNPTFTLGLSNNSVAFTQGQTTSLQVMLASVQGYQGAVQLSCSGLPAGVSCNFSPADVSLNAGNAGSVLSITSNSTIASDTAMVTNVASAMLLPWNMAGMLGIFSIRFRRKYRFGTLAIILFAAGASLACLTGCGLSVRDTTQPYQVTVTAVGVNQQSQSQVLTLNITGPAASF